jgi:hypothetical protein
VATTFLIAPCEDADTWPLPLLWVAPLGTWILSIRCSWASPRWCSASCGAPSSSELGIPDLFWHESMKYQFLAGLGTGLLAADLGLIGFLLDARRPG